MATQRKSKAKAKEPKAPEVKIEAPVVEEPKVEAPVVEEPKAEAPVIVVPKEKELVIDSNPVKVEEPKRQKLEKYVRPETNQHEGESKWVEPNHGIAQSRFGMGRLKHRMRTRKSRYEQ